MLRSMALLLLAPAVAAQTPPPQATPITRGSGWAEPWQARWALTPMLEVNLATGNLVCGLTTGRFQDRGLPPHHDVTLVHNAQRASVTGDFTGGFGLGGGWSSNLGVSLSFPSSGVAELVLGDGNRIEFEDQGGTWEPEVGSTLSLAAEGSGWVVTDKSRWKAHLDSSGKLTSLESSEGNRYVVTWGTQGVSSAVEPSGRGATFDYDTSGRLESVEFPTGTLWTLTYGTDNRLASITHVDYGSVSMTYDGSGRIQTFTDYEGFTWEFAYWGSAWPDRLKTITFPDQTEASLAYAGLVSRVITTVTGTRGELWKSVHDVADSPALMATIDPLSKVAVFAYDADKRLISYENELGHEWTYDYDAQGNLTTVTDPLLRVKSFTHDSVDRLEEVEVEGETTHLLYADTDHERLATSIVEPRDDLNIAATTTLDYFGPLDGSAPGEWNGALAEVVDPEGVSTRFDFDPLGLIEAEHEGPAWATGRIEAVFDGLIAATYVDSGGMGYPGHFPDLPALPSQLGGRLQWSVAAGGAWDWRGQYAAQSFDVVAPIDSGTGFETSNVLRTFERDHFGRVTEFTEQSEETIAYASSPPSTPPTRTICVTYRDDSADGAFEVELPNGHIWTWRHDLAGRVASVARDDGSTETTLYSLTYFADGNPASSTYADGTSSQYTYEDNGLVATIEHRSGSTVLLSLAYAYDARNLPITLTEVSSTGTLVKEYGYDQRGRLTYESRDDGTSVELRSYAYDQAGNRVELEVRIDGVVQQTTIYHYDREDVSTYQSDNNRLTWTETVDGSDQLVETTWYFYDNPFGNVSRIVTNAAGTTAFDSTALVYTEYGQPWLSWEESWDDLGSGPVGVTRGDVIEVRGDRYLTRMWRKRDGTTLAPIGTTEWSTPFDVLTAAYTADASTGAQTEMFTRLPGIGRQAGSTFTAELCDALGSIRRTVRGSTITAMDYRAFGESLDATSEPFGFGGALGARRSFGGVALGDGKLVQMGWRMLAPADGRFAMRDPSGINGGTNVYTFVHNVPTVLVDPTGQDGILRRFVDWLIPSGPRQEPVGPWTRPEAGPEPAPEGPNPLDGEGKRVPVERKDEPVNPAPTAEPPPGGCGTTSPFPIRGDCGFKWPSDWGQPPPGGAPYRPGYRPPRLPW